MREFLLSSVLALGCTAYGAEPDIDRVRKHFESKYYSVDWGKVAAVDPSAELEIGEGYGHGHNLTWMRFVPRKDGVDVLRIDYGPAEAYDSKWPPDTVPVVVTSARMKPADYLVVLGDLAMVNAAEPTPNPKVPSIMSFSDFWVSARVATAGKSSMDVQWTGYDGSKQEIQYSIPRAAVNVVKRAIKPLKFAEHSVTESERLWASAKFKRDWKVWEKDSSFWWIRDRSIVMIGHIGDSSAVPALRDIMNGDVKDRQSYFAINAITKIVKKDVRDKPVEKMDVEKTRKKVLELIKDFK